MTLENAQLPVVQSTGCCGGAAAEAAPEQAAPVSCCSTSA